MYNPITFSPGNSNLSSRFLTTNNKGTVKSIDLNGNVESLDLSKFTSKHFFKCYDINSNGILDYIYLDNSKLEVFEQNKSIIFTHDFKKNIKSSPNIYLFPGNKNKIGVSSESENEIYLFNADGTLYRGFPLKGCSAFSIGTINSSQNHFNLLVGGENDLLYNYIVK
jgi:hypothetical protein